MRVYCRPGTVDQEVFGSVFTQNEYNLPDYVGSTVIDIGSHIGSFALAVLKRGAPLVICYEPEVENFKVLQRNLDSFVKSGRAILHNVAVGLTSGKGKFIASSCKSNTGGGVVIRDFGRVKIVSAKSVFAEHKNFLLKLDCEGAEHEILREPSALKALSIYGEYHGTTPLPTLAGFRLITIAHEPVQGYFLYEAKPCVTFDFPFDYVTDASGYAYVARGVNAALTPRLVKGNATLGLAPASIRLGAHIRLTTWESSEISSLVNVEPSSVLVVPCEHNADVFRRAGWFKPIEVLPQWGSGSYSHMPAARPFKFICVARDNNVPTRKGIDELIKWFTEAFQTESDVSLTIKQSIHCIRRYTYDKRITIIHEDFDRAKYFALLAEHHCGIFLSGAEAWNFPLCELMAAGRPSICIPYGGPADFANQQTSWLLPHKLIQSPKEVYNGVGKVAFPCKRGTIQAMREAYSDQILLAEKAAASARNAQSYTEARFAARLRQIVDKYG